MAHTPREIAECFSGHRFEEAFPHLAEDVVDRRVVRHLRVPRRCGVPDHVLHGRGAAGARLAVLAPAAQAEAVILHDGMQTSDGNR